jgi:hypothetical protein
VRTLLQALAERVARIELLEAREQVEREAAYERSNGFELLRVRLTAR